jgi:hypothetical protein
MKKFAGASMDVSDLLSDEKIDYLVGLSEGDPDDLIKNAHIPSKDEVATMPTDDFALVLYHPDKGFLKKFACHDKYVTKLNIKILQDTHQNYPDEIVKTASYYLGKAAKYFHLVFPEDLKKLAEGKHLTNIVDLADINDTAFHKKQASFVKIAEPKIFALPDEKKYPIDTPELVKKAIVYFEKTATKFQPIDAILFAANVKTAATQFNIDTEDTLLEKYSNLTSSRFSADWKENIRMRRPYVKEDERGVYDELIEKAAEFGVVKTAETLEIVDRKLGVNRQWGQSISDPFVSILGMKKEAMGACCTHKGKKIKASLLKKAAENIVDSATLRDFDGPEAIDVFESLPMPIKDKIAKNI